MKLYFMSLIPGTGVCVLIEQVYILAQKNLRKIDFFILEIFYSPHLNKIEIKTVFKNVLFFGGNLFFLCYRLYM